MLRCLAALLECCFSHRDSRRILSQCSTVGLVGTNAFSTEVLNDCLWPAASVLYLDVFWRSPLDAEMHRGYCECQMGLRWSRFHDKNECLTCGFHFGWEAVIALVNAAFHYVLKSFIDLGNLKPWKVRQHNKCTSFLNKIYLFCFSELVLSKIQPEMIYKWEDEAFFLTHSTQAQFFVVFTATKSGTKSYIGCKIQNTLKPCSNPQTYTVLLLWIFSMHMKNVRP